MQAEPTRVHMWLEECHHRGHGNLRLEGNARDPAIAWIEMRLLARLTSEWAIVIAQHVAQLVVAGGAAEGLDMLVLVECRDALCGQLPADPVGLLDEMDMPAPACGGKRGSNSTRAAADNKDIATDDTRISEIANSDHRN